MLKFSFFEKPFEEDCENGKANIYLTIILNQDSDENSKIFKENVVSSGFRVISYFENIFTDGPSFSDGETTFSSLSELLENVETPYFFFANDHFDFEEDEANFERMIRGAENLSADMIGLLFRLPG